VPAAPPVAVLPAAVAAPRAGSLDGIPASQATFSDSFRLYHQTQTDLEMLPGRAMGHRAQPPAAPSARIMPPPGVAAASNRQPPVTLTAAAAERTVPNQDRTPQQQQRVAGSRLLPTRPPLPEATTAVAAAAAPPPSAPLSDGSFAPTQSLSLAAALRSQPSQHGASGAAVAGRSAAPSRPATTTFNAASQDPFE
jgi:hypothetical protein